MIAAATVLYLVFYVGQHTAVSQRLLFEDLFLFHRTNNAVLDLYSTENKKKKRNLSCNNTAKSEIHNN